ncbi:helix-turn-helix transcriptional regulator [Paenibacillus arenilitoris]|uniref:AraC family transcriptional regulator n=1 Tax=Paenibacillus arenilitoris TaxID=2772299 RepID=A0A927CR93_9BACL|nr:AraC family transcriptional regulator [Paenibacillus arenilitoris]MBD2872684.1 AraC family transcriptional regulator [Paenibacillus arenilitoris]
MQAGLFKREWLERDACALATAYYFKQWDHFDMPFHRHDAVEIMYAISGVCRIEMESDDMPLRHVELKKGEFIILNADLPHRLIVESHTPCRMLNIEFKAGGEREGSASVRQLAGQDRDLRSLLDAPAPYLVLKDSSDVYQTLKMLVLELDGLGKEPGPMIGLLFHQLLILIARLHRESACDGSQQHDLYMNKCLQFIHHNYDRDIQAKDIAAAVNLHHGYLHRIFRARLGQSITEYLTELRLEKAKMLLRQTDIPIADICEYIGVGSREYFHAWFKKNAGVTPVKYRSENNGIDRKTMRAELAFSKDTLE